MKLKLALLSAAAIHLMGCGIDAVEETQSPSNHSETLGSAANSKMRRSDRRVPGQYLVVLNDNEAQSSAVTDELAGRASAKPQHRYEHALKGFAARMSEAKARELSDDPRVAYVEEDGEMTVDTTQTGATWGLDRIDQVALPLSTTYTYTGTGSSTHAYVIDTGIRKTHSEFTGRVGAGTDFVGDGQNGNDCNGHGTHVSGIIAGTKYGVAKRAIVHPVRVLSCSGGASTSTVIAGIDWVKAHHTKPAVANLSLGGPASTALDSAVSSLVAAGVTTTVAAGNSNADACTQSPARAGVALTVASTGSSDFKSSFSNWGFCVDVNAPGELITSAGIASDTSTAVKSGTSMAAPYVAGVAAIYLTKFPTTPPSGVGTQITTKASLGPVKGLNSSTVNKLLNTAFLN